MKRTKTKILIGSSEIHKRSFMYKVREHFRTSNAPGSPFLLRATIHREIMQLMHFFIEEAHLHVELTGDLQVLAKRVAGLPFQATTLRSSASCALSENKCMWIVDLLSDDYVAQKAEEYVPQPLREFLCYFLLRRSNRKRLLQPRYKPTKKDKQVYRYVLSSERFADNFLFNPTTNQYLVIQYQYEQFFSRSRSHVPALNRQFSFTQVSYRGRRGSYESFDVEQVGYIYLIPLGLFWREDRFRRPHYTVLRNDIKHCGMFYRENHPRVVVILSAFQLLQAAKLHPFPNKFHKDYKQYSGPVAIPGTLSKASLDILTDHPEAYTHKILRDIKSWIFESLIIEGIDRKDILQDFQNKIGPRSMLRIFSSI